MGFDIPEHWTPAQAQAALDLLAQLTEAIFRAYERPLLDLGHRDALGLSDDAAPLTDDPIPF